MTLTIDIGNTRTKAAVFDKGQIVFEEKFEDDVQGHVLRLVERYRPQGCAWCSVGASMPEAEAYIESLPCPVLKVTGTTPSPLEVAYTTPETLGADRLAAVVGASSLHPETNLLIIDAGTCITYDIVNASGAYLGGNISPGLEMRLETLHSRTARLPQVDCEGDVPDLGYNTETAIRAGVIRGIGYELQGCIRHWQKRYPALKVFLTGGDRYAFSDAVRKGILTDSHLVARGLYCLYHYNTDKRNPGTSISTHI